MINLIRNELKKVFSKKSLYIVLILAIAFCVLANVMNKKFVNIEDDDYIYQEKMSAESQLQHAKEIDDIEMINSIEAQIEAIDLVIKYPIDSWQRNCRTILQNAISKVKVSEDLEEKENLQGKVDFIIKNFEEDNWRPIAENELEDLNSEIELLNLGMIDEDDDDDMIESLKDKKQVLEWRLEKDIPYGNNDLNVYLENWLIARNNVRYFEKRYNPSHESKRENQTDIETVAICEYAIENGIDLNITEGGESQLKYSLSTDAKSLLLKVFDSYGFFIILASVIVAGTIVSEEFNKGTIKLLLVRPYKRTKILLAKFLTCIIVLILSYILIALIQTIVGGILFGFDDYLEKTVIYNFNTNKLEKISIISYLIISGLAILPQYLLLMTLSFVVSILITNSPVAIALPFVGTIGAEIINVLVVNYSKARFLLCFVTPNWDLSMYMFGKLPILPGMTLGFSIGVCVIYFAIMVAIGMLVFKRRDIKNV